MIPHQNCEVIVSVLFFYIVKIVCAVVLWYRSMYKQSTLTSIPERNEDEEEHMAQKWVPKKKHEVLKAKYKCLKKLFQVYDASVIGILPESYENEGYLDQEMRTTKRRKKRSRRTKTDAGAGTSEVSSGDVSLPSDIDRETIATATIRDLKTTQSSWTCTQLESPAPDDHAPETMESVTEKVCEEIKPQMRPCLVITDKCRPTRFQCFIRRIFGVRRERRYQNYVSANGHVYALSDNNISHEGCEKRRRRGLRLRRLRRAKKVQSEIVLADTKSNMLLSYLQSVQKNYLMDTTPRQCPILGCRMMSYGIINYNDHLNLCHFNDRKYNCLYCHEGFETESEKMMHENEHIGISKLNPEVLALYPARNVHKQGNDAETDVKGYTQEEKLKKIVSFFDKISDAESIIAEIKSRCSASDSLEIYQGTDSDKRTASRKNFPGKCHNVKDASSCDSNVTSSYTYERPVACHVCGEQFNHRRQLNLHVDLEHRIHNKFSKYHSCAGIVSSQPPKRVDMISEDGKIKVQSVDRQCVIHRVDTSSSVTQETLQSGIPRMKSEECLSCDASSYILYNTNVECIKKRSKVKNVVRKVRSGINSYKWEPGTKIIRV